MGIYVVKRFLSVIPVLIGISIIIFFMVRFIPGDPISVMLGTEGQNPVVREAAMKMYNLDKPVHVQYVLWLQNIAQGSFGRSITLNQPVEGLIFERLPRTLLLMIGGIVMSLLIALPCGILAAAKRNTWSDLGITTAALILLSIPGFWLGIVLILVFAVMLHWLPATGYVYWSESPSEFVKHLILPTIALGGHLAASTTRYLRSSMLDVLRQDYIQLARTKGASERRVLFIHALRNAAIPTITVIGLQMGYLLGGAIIVERVFAYPGMGLLLIGSIFSRDYPVIQGAILVFASTFVFVNLFIDLMYTLIDPRIRYGQ